jgi:hypothetical protein
VRTAGLSGRRTNNNHQPDVLVEFEAIVQTVSLDQ